MYIYIYIYMCVRPKAGGLAPVLVVSALLAAGRTVMPLRQRGGLRKSRVKFLRSW